MSIAARREPIRAQLPSPCDVAQRPVFDPSTVDDLLTIDDLAKRMRLSPKTLKQLSRPAGGLPLFRVTPNGPVLAIWGEIKVWIAMNRISLSRGD